MMDSCESHGWWEVDGQEECPSCEIARLRAEVERRVQAEARGACNQHHAEIDRLKRERDEALAALNDAKKALKIMNQNLDDLSRAKQEALAQVAVLILALEDALSEIHYNLGCDSRCEEKRHVLASPLMKACALLDRLAMLEDGAMTNQRLVWLEDRLRQLQHIVDSLEPLQEELRNHPLRGESDSLAEVATKVTRQLQLAEAVVEALSRCEQGAFSCHEPHDIRCPKSSTPEKWKGEWTCECGRDALDKALAAWEDEARLSQ